MMGRPVSSGRIHPRIPGYLGRALSLEFSAVQQYMTQASLVEEWGLPEAAARLRREMVEEMHPADRLTQRMLALGFAPAASQLRPARAGGDLAALLREDLRLEREIIALYQDAVTCCRRLGDAGHEDFFAALLEEEIHGFHGLEQWLASLAPTRHHDFGDRVYF